MHPFNPLEYAYMTTFSDLYYRGEDVFGGITLITGVSPASGPQLAIILLESSVV